jgi:hypothetical protein
MFYMDIKGLIILKVKNKSFMPRQGLCADEAKTHVTVYGGHLLSKIKI